MVSKEVIVLHSKTNDFIEMRPFKFMAIRGSSMAINANSMTTNDKPRFERPVFGLR